MHWNVQCVLIAISQNNYNDRLALIAQLELMHRKKNQQIKLHISDDLVEIPKTSIRKLHTSRGTRSTNVTALYNRTNSL